MWSYHTRIAIYAASRSGMVDDVMSAGVQEGGIATACGLIGLELQTTSSDRFDRHLGCCFCHRCGQSSVVLSGNAHHNLLCAGSSYLGLEDVTLLEDLLDNVFLLVSSELIVELAVGGSVEDTGGALSSGLLALVGYGGVADQVGTYLWVTKIFQPLTT
jgi:hypothetical protein